MSGLSEALGGGQVEPIARNLGAVTSIILCGTDNPQGGSAPYYIGYCDLVDGYRHAWLEGRRIRRGRKFGHPPDPRCPECAEATP